MTNDVYHAELKIGLEIGGEDAKIIVGMYETVIMDDINQSAWNMCDCNDQILSEKFDNLTINTYEIEPSDEDNIQVKVTFQVAGNDAEFIEKVIADYMDGFKDYIDVARNGYYSRTGSRVGTDITLKNWEIEKKFS